MIKQNNKDITSKEKHTNYNSSLRSLKSNFSSKIVSAYDTLENKFNESFFCRLSRGITGKFFKFKRLLSHSCENSKILNSWTSLINLLLEKPLRYYGAFFFFFGIFISAFATIREISLYGAFSPAAHGEIQYLVVGVLSVLFSMIMLSSQKSIASLFLESRFVSFILFDVLCFSKKRAEKIKVAKTSHTFPVIFGIVLSALAVVFSLELFGKAVLLILLALIIFKIPENGILITLLSLPFFDNSFVSNIVFMVCAAFILKVLRNKRVYKIEFFDVSVIFFSLIVLISGIISVKNTGSFGNAILILLFILFGVVIGNSIKTSKLIERCFNALLISCTAVAFIGIICFLLDYFDIVSNNLIFSALFDVLNSIPFSASDVYSELIVLSIPIALANSFSELGVMNKGLSFVSLIILIVFAFITFDISIWVYALLAIINYFCILRPKLFFAFAGTAFAAFLMYIFIPIIFDSLKEFILSYFNAVEGARVNATSVLPLREILARFNYSGVGIGADALQKVVGCIFGFGQYDVNYNLSLFASVVVQYGILGAVSLLVLFIVFFLHCVGFYYSDVNCNHKLKPYVAACLATVLSVLLKGIFFETFLSCASMLFVIVIIFMAFGIKRSVAFEYGSKDKYSVFSDEYSL